MRRTFVATMLGLAMLTVAMGATPASPLPERVLNPAVKALLAARDGHRPAGLLPSTDVQMALASALPAAAASGSKAPSSPLPAAAGAKGCANAFSAAGFPRDVRAGQDCGFRRQVPVQVAVDPADEANVVLGQADAAAGTAGGGIAYTLDGGRRWFTYAGPAQVETSVPLDPSAGSHDRWTYDALTGPSVAFGADGTMYAAFQGFDLLHDGYSGVWVLQSKAGDRGTVLHTPDPTAGGLGAAYQQATASPVGLVHDTFLDPTSFDDRPSIAVDPRDPRHLVATWTISRWACGPSGDGFCGSPVFFSQSTDGGATWNGGSGPSSPGSPVAISGKNPLVCRYGNLYDRKADRAACNLSGVPAPVFEADGSIGVAFDNCNVTKAGAQGLPGVCQVLFVRSTDGGKTWSPPVRIDADTANEPLNGYSDTLGAGCPQYRRCLPPNGYAVQHAPSIAAAATGELAAFWSDFRNGSHPSSHDEDVFASISTDGGLTWSPASRVSAPDGAAQFSPSGGVGEDRTLYVAYYDRSYGDCESTGCLDVTLATSTDDGGHWRYRRVTTASMPSLTDATDPAQAGFIGGTALALGPAFVHLAWTDTRGLNGAVDQDAYYAKVKR